MTTNEKIGQALARDICHQAEADTVDASAFMRVTMTVAIKLSHAVGHADTTGDPVALSQIIRAMRDELFNEMAGGNNENEK